MTDADMWFDAPDDAPITVIGPVSTLRQFVESIKTADGEGILRFYDDGITATLVDPANIVMVESRIPAETFTAYRFQPLAETAVGVDFGAFDTLFGWTRLGNQYQDGDPVRVDVTDDGDRIHLSGHNPDTGVGFHERRFGIDPDALRDEPEVPEQPTGITARVDGSAFADAVRAATDGMTEAVTLTADPSRTDDGIGAWSDDDAVRGDLVMIGADSTHADPTEEDGLQTIRFSDAAGIGDDPDAAGSVTLSLDYVSDISQVLAGRGSVSISIADDFPTVFRSTDTETGVTTVCKLAPRIGDNSVENLPVPEPR